MGYLISKIIICLLLAFFLGLIVGWLLRNQLSKSREEALIADTEGQMETIERLERERDDIRRKFQVMERDNVDLNIKILGLINESSPFFNEQESLTANFKQVSNHLEQSDIDENSTLNESDSLLNIELTESDTFMFNTEDSTDNPSDQTLPELEEVTGEWDPLTAESSPMVSATSGAEQERDASIQGQNTSIDIPDQPANEEEPDIETRLRADAGATNPFIDEQSAYPQVNASITQKVDKNIVSQGLGTSHSNPTTHTGKTPKEAQYLAGDTLDLSTEPPDNLGDHLARSGDYDIEEIEGIGKGYAQRLRKIGIETTLQLLGKITDPAMIPEIAGQVNKKEKVVRSWITMADLIRVPGIRGKFAERIAASGIHSVQQLAKQDAVELTHKITQMNTRENRNRTLPTLEMVTVWIAAAKNLPNAIEAES